MHAFVPGLVTGAVLIAGLSAAAQTPAGARSTADGVYTKVQADRGKTLYFDQCVTCHGDQMQGGESAPAFTGREFSGRWTGQPVGVLYDYINTQMPIGRPGAQGAGGSADIVAYILAYNGLPAGAAELPPDSEALQAVTIAIAKP